MVTPVDQWEHFGFPGHFIMSYKCQFHLCTKVGDYLVSTVGKMILDDNETHEIGCGRLYETMVFRAGAVCTVEGCDCGLPTQDGSELDFNGYNTPKDATVGHFEMCLKYSERV